MNIKLKTGRMRCAGTCGTINKKSPISKKEIGLFL
jgi:hypothetical protein